MHKPDMETYVYGHTTPDTSSSRTFPKSPATSLLGESTSIKSSQSSLGREVTPGLMDVQLNGTIASTRATPAVTVPKPRRLRKPRTLYPMDYGRHMRDMEHWDNMFFRRATGRHTWVRKEDLPRRAAILDLGCGYGTWAIMTARENTDCRVYGFDSAEIQPNLNRIGLQDIARRVTWIHGDMLKALPFQDEQFDLVRASSIEFCVPENKWADLFQEIDRVLKPGGAFESSQDCLIIPCPRFAPREPLLKVSNQRNSTTRSQASDELANVDPRDHSKLKVAFDAMLEVRFLNPKITTMIPFFMNLHFTNVLMTPTLNVMLPPSSFIRSHDEIPDGKAAEPLSDADPSARAPYTLEKQMGQHTSSSEVMVTNGGHMHLTYTMNAVLACREAIWEQFEALNPELSRSDFDGLMRNWELDMRDRIDMRGTLQAGFGWKIPADSDREDGYRKTWRENMVQLHKNETPWDAQPLPESCRTVRAFIGFKPQKQA